MRTKSDATIHVADLLGPVLTGRPMAATVTRAVEEAIARGDALTLDFAGVRAVSPSFADELFGKLSARDPAGTIRLTNLSDHLQSVARMAQRQRRTGDVS
jgi:hypothetical protein